MVLPTRIHKALNEIRRITGSRWVDTREEVVGLYTRDASGLEGKAVAVVLPGSSQEVSGILRTCYKYEVPVYVQGGASGLAGAAVPENGIVLSMERFDKIVEKSILDSYVVVEAAVRISDLNADLRGDNMFFPIDPSSARAASVGGAINTNAGGMRGAKYGTMRDWVLGLELVVPDDKGSILWLGSKLVKCRHGYDLARLIVGSEGTLGVVTRAVLRILPLPRRILRFAAYYGSVNDLVDSIIGVKRNGIQPLIMEFVEEKTVEIISRTTGIKAEKGHLLIMDIDVVGDDKGFIDYVLEIIGNRALTAGAATTPSEKERLYSIRRAFSPTALSMARSEEKKHPGSRYQSFTEDITVPPSRVAEAIEMIKELTESLKLPLMLAGHIGDGNLHPRTWLDISGRKGVAKAEEYLDGLTSIAIKLGGCISGEHGIGVLKKKALVRALEHIGSLKTLEIMKGIKRVFDPKNILNPGKIF